MSELRGADVVVATDVLVAALAEVSPHAAAFPPMPPMTNHPHADVLGAFVEGRDDCTLILSEEILEQFVTVLTDDAAGLGWNFDAADHAADLICDVAQASGGGFVTPAGNLVLPSVSPEAAIALQTAASKDLGHPRSGVVVTDDRSATGLRIWEPPNETWPSPPIGIMTPDLFRKTIVKARLRMRPNL